MQWPNMLLQFGKQTVKTKPNTDPDQYMSQEKEPRLQKRGLAPNSIFACLLA